jgi:gamma-glutamylcyclotransferase (GGCT)/AIG2-like uncharacterized protein YtfP
LFVYGTLVDGLRREWRARVDARRLGSATIRGRLYDLGAFPGLVLDGARREERVAGELYELADPGAALGRLDEHEECFPDDPVASVFVRRLVTATLEDGRRRRAWTYAFNREVGLRRRILGGDWRRR